jgi:uncharacterized RDD family membrane protein YckC
MMNSRASAGRRLAAFAIDYAIVSLYAILLAVVSLSLSSLVPGSVAVAEAWMFDLLAFSTLVLPATLYFALSEASSQRATLGKRRLGLVVVDKCGRRLGVRRSLVRSGIKFLPWQIAHTSLFQIPGWPMAVTTIPPLAMMGLAVSLVAAAIFAIGLFVRSRRTLYDVASRSRVVRG